MATKNRKNDMDSEKRQDTAGQAQVSGQAENTVRADIDEQDQAPWKDESSQRQKPLTGRFQEDRNRR